MRCHYLSDLHLESQDFPWELPSGDVLVVAGDLCHAARLDPARSDKYSALHRERVLRFADRACARFRHVLLVPGNHDHYDGVLGETAAHLRRWLPGFTVLHDETVDIGGVCFFGSTLWSDFEGRSLAAMDRVRRRMGEYFFVKVRQAAPDGSAALRKFRPEDALAAFDAAAQALARAAAEHSCKPLVVVTHHAPSRKGLDPLHMGNGLDAAYASDLDAWIAGLPGIRYWVHGHTHVRRRYVVGATRVLTNARGFDGRSPASRGFTPTASFDVAG